MTTPDFAIAIMAAGKGTRLKSKRPKVLHEIGGRALLVMTFIRRIGKAISPLILLCGPMGQAAFAQGRRETPTSIGCRTTRL